MKRWFTLVKRIVEAFEDFFDAAPKPSHDVEQAGRDGYRSEAGSGRDEYRPN